MTRNSIFFSGNSGGGHADYWDLFWSNQYPRIQGEREKKVWEKEKEKEGGREEWMRGRERGGKRRKDDGKREREREREREGRRES